MLIEKIKSAAKFIFAVWMIMAVTDYVGMKLALAKQNGKAACQNLFSTVDWRFHVLMPGMGNACLDKYGTEVFKN